MNILFNRKFFLHNPGSKIEGAYRLKEFRDKIEDTNFNGERFISLVHSKKYQERIKKACWNRNVLAEVQLLPESYECACLAVGLTIIASQQNDFAVVRPPGHHANEEKESGFCLFNNIAIASQKLIDEGKKVFILDIDGHHGDGTQSIFYDSDKLFYCSIHQDLVYPGTGNILETGEGKGRGYNFNIPLRAGSGNEEFLVALDKAIEKGIKFHPDIVGVSAGFDGYFKDKLLDLNYSTKTFYDCGYRLGKHFKNIFAVLEGGYHEDLKKCVDSFIGGINSTR